MLFKSLILLCLVVAIVLGKEEQIMLKGRVHCANNRNYREMAVAVVDQLTGRMYKPVMPSASGYFQVLVHAEPMNFSPSLLIFHRCDLPTRRRVAVSPFTMSTPYVYYTKEDIELS